MRGGGLLAWMQTAAGKAQKFPAKLSGVLRRRFSEQPRGEEMRGTSSVRRELQNVQQALFIFACWGVSSSDFRSGKGEHMGIAVGCGHQWEQTE